MSAASRRREELWQHAAAGAAAESDASPRTLLDRVRRFLRLSATL